MASSLQLVKQIINSWQWILVLNSQFINGANFAASGAGVLPETNPGSEIYEIGGRKFAFQNVGPMGCLPLAKQENEITGNECVEELLALAKLHNNALLRAAQVLETQLQGFKYLIFDYYTSLYDIIKNPSKCGFQVADVACCRAGVNNASHCGTTPYALCSGPREYVFFDGAHPSETANSQLAKLMWNGEPSITKPYNLKQLFELETVSDFISGNYSVLNDV